MSKVTKEIIKFTAEVIILLLVLAVVFDPENGILIYTFNYLTYAEPLLLQHYIASLISTASSTEGEYFSTVKITGNPYELDFYKSGPYEAYVGINTAPVQQYLIKTNWEKLDPLPVMTKCSFAQQYVKLQKTLSQVLYVQKKIENGNCVFYISQQGAETETCSCSDWIEQGCGKGACGQASMLKTRTCLLVNNEKCDVESICESDPNCMWFWFDISLDSYSDTISAGDSITRNVTLQLNAQRTKNVTLTGVITKENKETINFVQNGTWYPFSQTPVNFVLNVTDNETLTHTETINFVQNGTWYLLSRKYVTGILSVFNMGGIALPPDQYEYNGTEIKLTLTDPAYTTGVYYVYYNYTSMPPPDQYEYNSTHIKLTLTNPIYSTGNYDAYYTYSPTIPGASISFTKTMCEPSCYSNITVSTPLDMPQGTYMVNITAKSTDGDLTKSVLYSLTLGSTGTLDVYAFDAGSPVAAMVAIGRGDVNWDGVVNNTDLFYFDTSTNPNSCLDTIPEQANWSIDCDMDLDNSIGVKDISIVSKNLGNTIPIHTTNFNIPLNPGTYELRAKYNNQIQNNLSVVVNSGQTTTVNFNFPWPPSCNFDWGGVCTFTLDNCQQVLCNDGSGSLRGNCATPSDCVAPSPCCCDCFLPP